MAISLWKKSESGKFPGIPYMCKALVPYTLKHFKIRVHLGHRNLRGEARAGRCQLIHSSFKGLVINKTIPLWLNHTKTIHINTHHISCWFHLIPKLLGIIIPKVRVTDLWNRGFRQYLGLFDPPKFWSSAAKNRGLHGSLSRIGTFETWQAALKNSDFSIKNGGYKCSFLKLMNFVCKWVGTPISPSFPGPCPKSRSTLTMLVESDFNELGQNPWKVLHAGRHLHQTIVVAHQNTAWYTRTFEKSKQLQ